jgi:hypothetical protein
MATALNAEHVQRESISMRLLRCAQPILPPIGQMLVEGGDGRIDLDAEAVANKYGCPPFPDAGLNAFGSSTASAVSGPAFAAAERLRYRLIQAAAVEPQAVTYARELQRIRSELLKLCGVADIAGLEVVFGASGTDLHLIAGQLVNGTKSLPGLAVMVDAVETGSCVPSALAGQHFSYRTALGDSVNEGMEIINGLSKEVLSVALRHDDGAPRSMDAIDAEVSALVGTAATQGRRVLLTLVDVSKSGMIAPSPACALELRRRWPDLVEVLVDACQFRIAPPTLRAYLQHGFMVALTGSKFLTGPTFSGALLFPGTAAQRFRGRLLPRALAAYSVRADWPQQWAVAGSLSNVANFGLLLRWEAALQELRAFRAIPEEEVTGFLETFGLVIRNRLLRDTAFESLPMQQLDRTTLLEKTSWDRLQTIFPFILYRHTSRDSVKPLTHEETVNVYRLLQTDLSANPDMSFDGIDGNIASSRFQLGQPVACGHRSGVPVSALRICASARLVVEATSGGKAARILKKAIAALDKTAQLVYAKVV